MKKLYSLLGAILITSLAFAQGIKIDANYANQLPTAVDEGVREMEKMNLRKQKNKAFLDTLFYESFTGGLPVGWSITNSNSGANNFAWTWDTLYRTGEFSGAITRIKSTTGATGFMLLKADNFNTPVSSGTTDMDTWFSSPAIPISPTRKSVIISYQQYLRFCCNVGNQLVLDVSTDNSTWTTFDARDNLPVNTANVGNAVGVLNHRINISEVAAGADSVFFRFRSTGNSHYFWMIDDIAVIEGPQYDLEISNPYMEFHGNRYGINPFYNQIPYELFSPVNFTAQLLNNGWDTSFNANMQIGVEHTAGLNGSLGSGQAYSSRTNVGTTDLLPFPTRDTMIDDLQSFVPLANGEFRVDFLVSSDNAEQFIGDETSTQNFITTDTVYARDDGDFGGGTGPASYLTGNPLVVGGSDFDACGTLYNIEARTLGNNVVPTSITYYISNDPNNIGVEIIPSVWAFDETQTTLALAWDHFNTLEYEGNIYKITANDTSSFLTLPLDTAGVGGLDSGQYVVGWEVISGGKPNGTGYMEVANDLSTSVLQVPVSSFVYHEHSGAVISVAVQPVIRLNLAPLPIQTSIEEPNSTANIFDISPNPNNGVFNINISVENRATYNLNVRNTLGQIVYSDVLNIKGAMTERLDLSSVQKGIYLISLENDTEKLQKKVILK